VYPPAVEYWADFSRTFGSRGSFKLFFSFHFLLPPPIYGNRVAIVCDRSEEALLRRFVLCCGAQIQSVDFGFLSSRFGRGQSSLFSRLWIAGRRPLVRVCMIVVRPWGLSIATNAYWSATSLALPCCLWGVSINPVERARSPRLVCYNFCLSCFILCPNLPRVEIFMISGGCIFQLQAGCSYFLQNCIVYHMYHLGRAKDHLQPYQTGIIDRLGVLLNGNTDFAGSCCLLVLNMLQEKDA
jgi:hypothetical protein